MKQPKEDTRSLATVYIHTSSLVLMTVFSLAGNSLVCLAFYRNRRLRKATNFYVLSLSVNGLIMATFGFPFVAIASGLRKWSFSANFCQFNGFISYYISGVSLGTLALTAVNRYVCVVKPQCYPVLYTKKKTVFSIVFVWLFTLTTGLIAMLVTPISFEWNPKTLFCTMTKNKLSVNRVSHFAFVTVFVLPLGIILFCYGSIYWSIRRHNAAVNPSLQAANSQGTVDTHEIRASRVLLAAVIGFCLCWTPMIAVSILRKVSQFHISAFWHSFNALIAASSSWINPIIYGVMNRAMRKEFLKILRCHQNQN